MTTADEGVVSVSYRPLATMDEAAGFTSQHWRNSVTFPPAEGRGDAMRYQHRYGDMDIPVLHISGWYDDEQIGTPLNYGGMVAEARSDKARGGQRLLMGPWGHAVNAGSKLGEVDFGASAVIDLEGYQAAWLDWVLGGEDDDTTIEPPPPVRIFVMGTNAWRGVISRARSTAVLWPGWQPPAPRRPPALRAVDLPSREWRRRRSLTLALAARSSTRARVARGTIGRRCCAPPRIRAREKGSPSHPSPSEPMQGT